jgi:trans-aconitate 2-methyltransferase
LTSIPSTEAQAPPVDPWQQQVYLAFAGERARPAADLLARIDLVAPGVICDLGCGTGNITRMLAQRWPRARVTGVDASSAMLERARSSGGGLRWIEADVANWSPGESADLIFSNAALHWLGDHGALFPRLMGWLAHQGVLAVQMPRNLNSPAHRALAECIDAGAWRDRLEPFLTARFVAPPESYVEWITPLAQRVEVWTTTYYHLLTGDKPVLDWLRGAVLTPMVAVLAQDERDAFLAELGERLARAYPRRENGTTLFPFTRLFVIARRD